MDRETRNIIVPGGLAVVILLAILIGLLLYDPTPAEVEVEISPTESPPETPPTTETPVEETAPETPAPTTAPKIELTSFDKSIIDEYPGLEQVDTQEALDEVYFASGNKALKDIVEEKTAGVKTDTAKMSNLINYARTTKNDQNSLIAGLLYNAGFTNVTIVTANCQQDPIKGTQSFVVLYYRYGREYYIDLENDIWDPLDYVKTPETFKRICDDTLEVITPTMILRK